MSPIAEGSDAFFEAVASGGEYLWTVGENGELRIISNISDAIKHCVLFEGAPVQGAGTVKFSEGEVAMINDQSGHYYPWEQDEAPTFLKSGVDSFRRCGIEVPADMIKLFIF